MHLSFISTRGQAGLDAPSVTVEVHLSAGLPAFQVVGLGDGRSREIRSRVRAALISSHLKWPDFNITVNLTPAEPSIARHSCCPSARRRGLPPVRRGWV